MANFSRSAAPTTTHDAELRRYAGIGRQYRLARAGRRRGQRQRLTRCGEGSFLLIEYNMFQQYDDRRRDPPRATSNMAAYVDDLANQVASAGYIYQGQTWGD